MRKWPRIILALVVLGVAAVLMYVALSGPTEPTYQGVRLSVWLHGYNPEWQPTSDAIHQIGTNAIPTLLTMIQAKDSKLKLNLINLVQKQHLININFSTADQLNREASEAFLLLGPEGASNAVPELMKIFPLCKTVDSQEAILSSLLYTGRDSKGVIAFLLQVAAANTNDDLRETSLSSLPGLGAEPEIAVPALTKLLRDPVPGIREAAARDLAEYNPDAKIAIPELVRLLKDPEPQVRAVAADTLAAIDPKNTALSEAK